MTDSQKLLIKANNIGREIAAEQGMVLVEYLGEDSFYRLHYRMVDASGTEKLATYSTKYDMSFVKGFDTIPEALCENFLSRLVK